MPSIADFVSNLTKYGLARTNRFLVSITPPAIMGMTQTVGRQLQFSCEGASLPGATLETHEYRSYDMPVKVPGQKTYENADLTFRLDRDFTEMRFFRKWLDEIYDPKTGDVAYFDEIKGQVDISMLDTGGVSRLAVSLVDAYPASISPVELSWSNNDDYARLQVSFTYRYVEIVEDNTNYGTASTTLNAISSSAPTPLRNAMQNANSPLNYSKSMLRNSNLQTSLNGTKLPLTGILNKVGF